MELIDISHILNEDTPVYSGDYKINLSIDKSIEKDGYCSYVLSSNLHTGTHIDMPMHLLENNKKMVTDYSINNFTGKGVLLDVRNENPISMKPFYEEIISEESAVLLFTGFDKYFYTQEYFLNYPVVSDELAEFLLSKKIKILGMDTPSPDYSPFTFHKKLLENNIFVLENLTNLQELIGIKEFEVMAFPLKISAEASPVRAVCRII